MSGQVATGESPGDASGQRHRVRDRDGAERQLRGAWLEHGVAVEETWEIKWKGETRGGCEEGGWTRWSFPRSTN